MGSKPRKAVDSRALLLVEVLEQRVLYSVDALGSLVPLFTHAELSAGQIAYHHKDDSASSDSIEFRVDVSTDDSVSTTLEEKNQLLQSKMSEHVSRPIDPGKTK